DALTQEAVEVEQPRRDERVDVVSIVEGIEHLDNGDDRIALAQLKRTLNTPVKREVLVVLPSRISVRRGASAGRDRLRRPSLHAEVPLNPPTQFDKRKQVEPVTNVAVGVSV